MLGLVYSNRKISPELMWRCVISSLSAGITQVALLLIPHFFPFLSLLFQLLLSAIVLVIVIGFGLCCRRLLRVRASPPIVVLFHMTFVWLVYIVVIRRAVSTLMDIIFNGELAMILIGFFWILASDPGLVRHDFSSSLEDSFSEDRDYAEVVRWNLLVLLEQVSCNKTRNFLQELTSSASSIYPSNEATSFSSRRVRYCRSCKAFIRGFDHHCPAFGNCIGQKNYTLFMVLLVGFAITEASYAICTYQWIKRVHKFNVSMKISLHESLAFSTMLFSLLQVLWQVVFITWHIYCVCVNIRTDEWLNWRNYPEFHVFCPLSSGESEMRFRNPYNKGIVHNLKELLLT